MAKYRLSSASAQIVDAVRFDPEADDWPAGVRKDSISPTGYSMPRHGDPHHFIGPGYWVVTDNDGVRHALAPEFFEQQYEPMPVEPAEAVAELAEVIGPDLANVTEEDMRRIRGGEPPTE